jgi:glyoxylase-like metal-dependent hydrolase (beta-lactamase superfamily II)
MTSSKAELVHVTPHLLVWQAYDPKVKADLSSTALVGSNNSFLIDPIPLSDAGIAQLHQKGPAGIILTNGNHARASNQIAKLFDVPIHARLEAFSDARMHTIEIEDGKQICPDLTAIAIEGAAPGEIALHSTLDNGLLIVGDALINFEPHGFAILPRKYCSNQKQMLRSLRRLLDWRFDKILFAHGTPIISRGAARLRHLLDSQP